MSDDTFAALSKRLETLTQQTARVQQVNAWGMRSIEQEAHGPMAARTKYSDERGKTILEAIGLGASYAAPAEAAGISYETFGGGRRRNPALSVAIKKTDA